MRRLILTRIRLAAMAWIGLLALGMAPRAADRPPAPAPGSSENESASILGLEPLKDADLLVLGNGDRLSGEVLNESFILRAPYARVELDAARLVAIDLTERRRRLESVWSVKHDRLTGFLEASSIRFRLNAGNEIEIRKELLRKIVFRARTAPSRPSPPSHVARLFNGDCLIGQWREDPLPVAAAYGLLQLALRDVETVAWAPEPGAAITVQLKNGDVVRGDLAAEEIEFQLDIGPALRIHPSHFESLDCRPEAAPPKPSAAATALKASASTFRAPFDGPSDRARPGMAWIPPGRFIMGSPSNELDRDSDEGPRTEVVFPEGFWMAVCETRQSEFENVMGANPSHFPENEDAPVEKVSWQDAVLYCQRRTQRERESGDLPQGHSYRLPTEAEWEYACRAGASTRFSYGDDPSYFELADYAWYTGNSGSSTHSVGQKRPNAWGLFDMHGNVLEWCADGWSGALPGGVITNALAPLDSSLRAARGGSWLYDGRFCRSANRDDYGPSNRCSDLGFRVVLAPDPGFSADGFVSSGAASDSE